MARCYAPLPPVGRTHGRAGLMDVRDGRTNKTNGLHRLRPSREFIRGTCSSVATVHPSWAFVHCGRPVAGVCLELRFADPPTLEGA